MDHCDCEDCQPEIEGRTHLEVTDLYNDLCEGVRHWFKTKVASDKWDEYDESLSRWMDADGHKID